VAPAGAARRDLRYDMEITSTRPSTASSEIEIEVSRKLRTLRRFGRRAGHRHAALQPVRRPRQGPRPAGLLHGRAHLPDLPRPRRSDRETLPLLPGRGPGRYSAEAGCHHSPGRRYRHPHPPAGKGEAGPFGAPPGDLYIFIHIRRHNVFERDGTTLLTRVPITFTTAALGGEIEIPGLDGKHIKIEIPAGIQSGKQLRKRGEGMPVLQGRGRGDLVIEIMVETPTKLTARQKELLRELQETETGTKRPQSKGFFDRIKDAFGA
jgi:molecular chaperone DnaJ